MGKLKTLSGLDVCKILESHGFIKSRQKGSHIIMKKILPGSSITVPVPVPAHPEITRGTLQSIIRQSKLPRQLFESN